MALRTTGDREDAADALQEALISAFRRAESFRGDAQVTTWLHRIVVNACLDRIRRKRAKQTEPLAEDERLGDPEAIVRHEDEAEAGERRADVLAALQQLSADQRAALVLVDMEGYSVEEAAAILDCAPGTVKSRCSRGRARLVPLLTSYRRNQQQAARRRTDSAGHSVNGNGGITIVTDSVHPTPDEMADFQADLLSDAELDRVRRPCQRLCATAPPSLLRSTTYRRCWPRQAADVRRCLTTLQPNSTLRSRARAASAPPQSPSLDGKREQVASRTPRRTSWVWIAGAAAAAVVVIGSIGLGGIDGMQSGDDSDNSADAGSAADSAGGEQAPRAGSGVTRKKTTPCRGTATSCTPPGHA